MKTIYYYELIKCENGKEEEDALANCLINNLLSEKQQPKQNLNESIEKLMKLSVNLFEIIQFYLFLNKMFGITFY